MSVVAYRSFPGVGSEVQLRDSLGHTISSLQPEPLLDFLIYSCSARVPITALRIAWELEAFLSPILALLPAETRAILDKDDRAIWRSYRLFHAKGRVFLVNKSHDEANYFSLAQFLPDDSEPRTIHALQSRADYLLRCLSVLGIPSPKTLSSPVAVVHASGILSEFGV